MPVDASGQDRFGGKLERRLRAVGAFALLALAGVLVALGLWLEVP